MPMSFREAIIAFNDISNINIIFLVVGTLVGLVTVGPLIIHRFMRIFGVSTSERVSSGALDASKAIAGYAALIMSFCIVEASGNLQKTEEVISREASAILNLDRVLLRSKDPALVNLRPVLHAYGRAIIDKEWPLLAHPRPEQHGAAEVDAAFTELSSRLFDFSPQGEFQVEMFREAIVLTRQLVEKREERLANAELSLPSLFWAVTLLIVFLQGVLAGLVSPSAAHAMELGGLAAAIGLLLSLLIILDLPFSGESAASPAAIERVLTFRFAPA